MSEYKYSEGDVRKVYDAGYNDGRYEKDYDPLSHYLVCDVIEHVESVPSVDTPCIREMCCNQFGERDEIQAIINSLQADVIARGARIKTLEDALRNTNEELHGAINNINETLENNICSTDLDDPDYWDLQTVHDNAVLLDGGRDA